MTDAMSRIQQELGLMGYVPVVENHGNFPNVIVIDYRVERGRFCDQTFRLGIRGDDIQWPEQAPHYIHVSPLIPDPQDRGPVNDKYTVTDTDGNQHEWGLYSRPPKDIWDYLPLEGKTMKAYMQHVRRFWEFV